MTRTAEPELQSLLQCVARISVKRMAIHDMSELLLFGDGNNLLLACGRDGLRALSLRPSALPSADKPASLRVVANRTVYRVAYDAHTITLLLIVWPHPYDWTDDESRNSYWQLVSLRRETAESEWVEVDRRTTGSNANQMPNMAVCGSRVLLGHRYYASRLQVFDVSAEHTLRDSGYLSLPNTVQNFFTHFACTRHGNDTLFAFSHYSTVSLHRLESLLPMRFEHIASAKLTSPDMLMFCKELLLVGIWNSTITKHAIVSLQLSSSALTEKRVLLDYRADVWLGAWTLVGDRLVLFDQNSGQLRDYSFA